MAARCVVGSWVRLAQADLAAADARRRLRPDAELKRLDRRQGRAERAYIGALRLLAEIRAPAGVPVAEAGEGAARPARKPKGKRPRGGPSGAIPRPLRDRLRGVVEASVGRAAEAG